MRKYLTPLFVVPMHTTPGSLWPFTNIRKEISKQNISDDVAELVNTIGPSRLISWRANPIRQISIMEYCEDGYENTKDTKDCFG
jgi:hypothetical protein